jgi:RNA polymerase sigma factor (sigma-70 family)
MNTIENIDNLQFINLILDFRNGRSETYNTIYKSFTNLIYNYAKGDQDLQQDLNITLIETLNKIDLTKFEADNSTGIHRYISVCIRNAYILKSKNRQNIKNTEQPLELIDTIFPYYDETNLELENLISLLNERQRTYIIYKYVYGYTDVEIGKMWGCSRQRVGVIKREALRILKTHLKE